MSKIEQFSWRETFSLILSKKVAVILLLGFSAGIPYFLIFSTLSLWLKEAGIERSTIAFLSWAALGYSFKFIWAPLVDQMRLPYLANWLGRRRSWLLFSQVWVILSIGFMALSDPGYSLWLTAGAAVSLGFAAATQDIVIDAYRIESADSYLQSILSSAYIAGYRGGMLLGGAGALLISDFLGGDSYSSISWSIAYLTMAFAMLAGVLTTLSINEPSADIGRETNSSSENLRLLLGFIVCAISFASSFVWLGPQLNSFKPELLEFFNNKALAGFLVETSRMFLSIACVFVVVKLVVRANVVPAYIVQRSYVDPITDFFERYGKGAMMILGLIALYRLSDIVMGVIANVFYADAGYSKQQIASLSKFYGLFATLAGGFLGGALSIRYGVYRTLLLGAILSALTNILFSYVAASEANSVLLAAAITADNLSGGLATAAFIAYLSSLTSVSFTAMQYAIFSSLMTLFPKLIAGYSGMMSLALGYEVFFYVTAALGIPAVVLVLILQRLIPITERNIE
ncbi:AmpG family muropeptide MFS transporter [Pseudoteredinibacter isoporae]|uniref:PAT family beta-lactamase induction signal transducer AmpG n=1 Tax=Pseudoteredinibacter isoporae TaxID=570281 RepID=A0A7X0MXH2_9GAMM|nr:MFS transporter [Pseudoteredinibacter isoporae]MBB6520922.1 PAT family beta-lactamase induction signal transducer AmpG [Pseudoteredinibacter isoporae]NHO86487.1 AmpG family muropeptide MFS transporter [Pseudoteredinibacter isoporae]NIB25061.1 AmpG family muropeptide MFS transporter [Pseudoteredinibacter isoporae]